MYQHQSYQTVRSNSLGSNPLFKKYLSHWPWFVLSVTLMLVLAYLYLSTQQPLYKIQASILVQDEQRGSEQSNSLKEVGVFAAKKVVENEMEILRSFTLMNRIADRLNLDVQYFRPQRFGKQELYEESPVKLTVETSKPTLYAAPLNIILQSSNLMILNGKEYPLNKYVNTPYGRLNVSTNTESTDTIKVLSVQVSKRSITVKRYLSNLIPSSTGKNSTVIQLSLEDAFPKRGEAILNQLIEEYNYAAITEKNKVAASTLSFIKDRLTLVSGDLANVEKDVEVYKSKRGITDLSLQAETFLKSVKDNDALLSQVNIKIAALNDLQTYLNNPSANQSNTPATVGLSDPILIDLIANLTKLEQQRDLLSRTSSVQNPSLLALDTQIKRAKRNMVENIETMHKMLTSSQHLYTSKNRELENEIRKIPQEERLLTNITRQQAVKNDLYTYLLKKQEETAVSFASAIPDSRIVDAAQSSDLPVKPVKSTLYVLFGLFGLIIPVAIISSRQALNTRVTRRIDVEDATSVPILAELVKNNHLGSIVMTPNGNAMLAEQIRTIRTELQYLRSDRMDGQVLLFTSSISNEGKSFVSLNVGISLSIANHRVVILDLDMRMPKMHDAFNLDNTVGMSDYLTGEATLDQVLKPAPGYPNLYLISSGPPPPNPTELLSSSRLKKLMFELCQQFDYIIIDTPPVGIVSDARLIAPFTDATFYLVRHNVTPRNQLKLIDKLYHEHRFQRLNIILNAVDGEDAYHYSDYKTSYPYSRPGER